MDMNTFLGIGPKAIPPAVEEEKPEPEPEPEPEPKKRGKKSDE